MSTYKKDFAELSADKRELLELLLEEEGGEFNSFPLSFAQQRLWFLDQFEPGSPLYNISAALRLQGRLDARALEDSLNEVVARHETLRTSFVMVGTHPTQVVADEARLTLALADLGSLASEGREAEVRRRVSAEACRPFDLARGPLVRASLLRLAEEEHVLLLTMHHIVSDGWSMDVLVREVAALYQAFSKGAASSLAELPIQYADYAAWQREHLAGPVLDEQLAYWRGRLAGAPPALELPTDRPRPAVQSHRGAVSRFTLPSELTGGLRRLSRAERATLFMTLLAGWQALLARYTGQTDIVIGSPVANRTRGEMENLIGFFVNILALRGDLSGDPSFRELLGRVREGALGAYAHQDVPFERLVEELQPERAAGVPPVFQVMFVLQNARQESLSLEGLRVTQLTSDSETSKFDLSLSVEETGDGLTASIEYSTDLFDASTVERMWGHYHQLLAAAANNPARRLSELPLLTEAERHTLLIEWNDTARAYPQEQLLHQLFEEQATATPEAVAVTVEQEEVTYGELNARANRLARHLRAHGVGADSLVGVMLERSTELVVSLLAVLKAGAAYVPFDPQYPAERLSFMLEDTGCAALVTRREFLGQLGAAGLPVVCLDSDAEALAAQSGENLTTEASAESLAYVIYTSGSTGRPKGVMVTHGAIANHMRWMQSRFPLTPQDAVLQKTPVSFDASVWEFWAPLLVGARLVVARAGGHRDPSYLAAAIREQGVTVLQVVPSLLRALLDEPDFAKCRGLRRLFCGGEELGVEAAARFRLLLPAVLVNLYGPTEATIDASFYECGEEAGRASVPIGRPVANTQMYILDQHLRPVPPGVAGELHIGGVQLARGYLSRPGLTAEKFIPDPFAAGPGCRLYKTGDLARYLPGGSIEYLGRLDHQVKIRGFRIELGEVEAALSAQAGVTACVVTVFDRGGDKRLVAYVVGAAGQNPTTDELRAGLKGRLPEYMMPSAFVMLDELPLMPNGKVDRKRLPAPDARDSQEDYAAPRTAVEEMLAPLWSEVLGVERVGRHDNFFRLGGHSLLATQLVSRVRQLFEVELPVRGLFESPTLAELAARVEAALAATGGAQVSPVNRRPREATMPPSFAQQRLWFLQQLDPENTFYNVPVALRLVGALDRAALERSLSEIVRRHEALRTTFVVVDGLPRQAVSEELTIPLPLIDLGSLAPEERLREAERLTAEEARRSFDLAHGPLVRASLLRLAEEEHVLLFTMHHIVSDGWSMGVLVREVAALYGAHATGVTHALPELPVQYADFAAWQREWLAGEVCESQLAYWKQRLAELPTMQLPTDHRRPSAQTFRGAAHTFSLPPRLGRRLKELSQRNGVTLYMTLLAAFEVLLMRYTGQEDIVVGSPIANRTREEIESLIGFFVNTLVMRTDLSGGPTFGGLLKRVRETALAAYAHQDVPFERLVEELDPERDLSRQPLFQVMFALQNAPMSALKLPGLTLDAVPAPITHARFDLELELTETEEAGIDGVFRCNLDLFDVETIRRMAAHLETLLEAAADDPGSLISGLRILTEAEERQLTRGWNETRREFALGRACAHELFAAQAARTPDAPALVADGAELTYRELNERANQLAHHLIEAGVGRGTTVGLYTERGAEAVVGLLGVLKAGAAYVPLNPEYPKHRVAFMIEDAGLRVVLTQESLLEGLPAHGAHLVCLDAVAESIARRPKSEPGVEVGVGDVAYVIYTSGSAGRPKGVLVEHGNLTNTLLTSGETFGFGAGDVTPCLAATSFDISLFELLNPLLTGGTLILLTRSQILDLDALVEQLDRVTIFHAVPSLLRQIVNHIAQQPEAAPRFARLRMIFTGGDAVAPDLLREAQEVFGAAELKVLYGPTEATIICSHYAVGAGGRVEGHALGRPLHNVSLRVYDRHGNLAPTGVAGELYIGGAGVARGYLGRDELTAERFITLDGERYYRTGDRARFLADGNLEFLGRIDEQVKVRGFRIELGEVEAELSAHPAVREAVATVHEGEQGDKRLVAYVVQDPLYVEEYEPQESAWQDEHVSQWQLLYDETYGGAAAAVAEAADDEEFNVIGWNSSYTGEPIPAGEMREWVENTVSRIRSLSPERVLEIGCGTGLLLLPLARHCRSYRGTDFSRVVLDELGPKVRARGLRHVELAHRRADEFDDAETGAYDVVVINSVVQYFPSIEYLVRVLEGAVGAVAPGGSIFVGDVRSLPLLEAFHTAVELHQSPAALNRHRALQRAQRRLADEKELVIAPDFFRALQSHLPQITDVLVELKRGRHHNELTRFRYDVVLRVGAGADARVEPAETAWREWDGLGAVGEALRAGAHDALVIRGVPSTRTFAEARTLELLKAPEGVATVGELRELVAREVTGAGAIDPEAWFGLGESHGYAASVSWSDAGEDRYDVLLTRGAERLWTTTGAAGAEEHRSVRAWRSYANNPLRLRWAQDFAHNLMPRLRAHLGERLPDYMVPATFVLLDELPLTPNGKVDRRTLPAPNQLRPEVLGGYVAPRTPVEELLAGMWADVLGVERVGCEDNFFDLGGHSLLITQLLSRVRRRFSVDLPLRHLFESPTVAGLAERVEEAIRAGAGLEAPPVGRTERVGRLPLSFAQERLWFIDQLDPQSTAYLLPAAIRLEGRLDVDALRQSLDDLVRRHESLRTSFCDVDGQAMQVISPEAHLELPTRDLSSLTRAEREAEVVRLAGAEAALPFDLTASPLVRATLLRLGEAEHVLLLTMHHIISDGWSMGVLIREVAALYEASAAGRPSPLAELPVQYADFAAWQRGWLQGEALDRQLSYWKLKLGGELPTLDLPTDRPRPAVCSFRGMQEAVALPPGLTEELKAFSRAEGVTLYMTLLAAWQSLLHRFTGQMDIVVGSPIANRNRAELEGLIGFFVNTLAMRTSFEGDPDFRDLLGRVRETALGAYAHQDLPFERLVEELQPERSLGHTPIAQVMFALQNAPAAGVETPELALSYIEAETTTAKFDLTLSVSETPEGLKGWLEYSTDLFEAATIRRLLAHFETLLREAVARPETRVSELPLLTGGDRLQLVEQWNDNATDYPREATIAQLVEEQSAATPDAVAVVCEGEALTYGELNGRANQLARLLLAQGVGADSLVGVMLERSAELVVSLLGVLKAGAAYVPLDPSYPAERLSLMLEDADCAALVTRREFLGSPAERGLPVICVEAEAEALAAHSTENLRVEAGAESLAYVIYTSGSTGRPKGVAVSHRAISRLVFNTNYVKLDPSCKVAQVANSSFDAATFEIWGALTHGAKLIVISRETSLSLREFAAKIKQHGVTTMFLTTALFNQLAREIPTAFNTVREVLVGGEAVDVRWMREVKKHGGPQRLLNVYGPTETTTFATWHMVEEIEPDATTIPIGQPISNTQLYVLDAKMEPVPVGVIGELYIGGPGVALGYLNRPELTAEKFIPDHFSPERGARLYRTGDRGRRLPDGAVEFIGRADNQVKLRGFRIELGEIEAALVAHGAVAGATVVVREDEPGDKRLVAYMVSGEASPTAPELRAYLKGRLPEYMVPSAFVALDALPLTPNGKVDRRALPAPEQTTEPASDYVAPRTPVEETLAGIWSEVLKVARVGAGDNFFDLGGHSLLATQVMSRMRQVFRRELPLRVIFESPTLGALALAVETSLRGEEAEQTPPVVAVVRDGELPLSFAQQRLWFIDQLEPGNAAYNLPLSVRLTGQLDGQALGHAVNEIVRRHESLRTTFTTGDGGRPQQVIHPAYTVELPLTDLSSLGESEREARLKGLISADAARPFDLARGPLLRISLLRLSIDEHVLLLTMHHIVSDGWSMGVLVREVAALYEAFSKGEPSPLAELPVQYADFAVWQRGWLRGEVLDRQLGYWRGRLAGAPPVLELPTDRPRPAVQGYRGAMRRFGLPAELAEGLRRVSRAEGATLFMTLLAGWQALLARYTGQTDIVVGTDMANRNRGETEGLIGFFVNMLAMRTDLSGDPTFTELLGRVRELTLGAYAHQDVPFERLVEELQPERAAGVPPVFQVVFVLQNAPMPELRLGGVTLSPVEFETETTHFDITLSMEETEDGLKGWFEYDTDLFDEQTIARMERHFESVLRAAASDPGRRVSELPLLDEGERRRLLADFNDTRSDYPRESCIHRLFEEQAARTPEAVALVCGDEELSYGELNARANKLARHLRSLGVGADSLVGVMMERSIEQVVTLVGVLKAGAAYVPFDPSYPLERLSFMVGDAQPPIIITQEKFADELPVTWAHVICLDTDWEGIATEAEENLRDGSVGSDSLAYVIYTSGSTGTPKGVSVPHRGVIRLVRGSDFAHFDENEVFLQLAPISFDASTFEVWGALLNGARLVIVPPEQPSLDELASVLVGRGVTTLWLTAGLFHQLVDLRPDALGGLRQLLAGGDVLSPDHTRRALEALGREATLINGYGPTENTTFTCCHRMAGGESLAGPSIPIGRPVANTRVYILDKQMAPAPVGVAGELYAGGDGLARGYLNRPGLTAERFVPDPFSTEPGARLYRTGDRARYLPNGEIEFLGRVDNQVKIRGFRIEPGEVEAALGEQTSVKTCVVTAREDTPGDKRLVAYVVAVEGTQELAASELRAYLKGRLPEYMVPSAFVVLDALPLTPNGKVDRRALPAPEWVQPGDSYVAPRTPVEEILAGIWCEVLGVERIGVNDNFFDLGGHSLLATQVVTRVRESLRVELPLRVMFESPTVIELAESVEAENREQQGTQVPPIVPAPRAEQLPLSFAQQRLWFIDQLEPASAAYNISVALRLTGRLDAAAFGGALNEVVRRHESLRTSFDMAEGQAIQVIADELRLELPLRDLSELPATEHETETRRLASADAARPFDLARGPLLRVSLLRLSPDEHVLLLTMHHIVSDGWSMGVLVREVAALYEAFSKGEPSPLAELPVQYADFAVWQRGWLRGEVLDRQLGYWRGRLAGAPPVLELPTDRPRPAVQSYRGALSPFSLPADVTRSLKDLGRGVGATLFMTLLAGWQALLARYSGQEDVVVGSPVANRNRGETEGLIGFFVNMLAMRTDLSGDPTFTELLGRVRELTLGAYAHQDVPFERLVEELQPERAAGVPPVFQVVFVLQNAPMPELRLGGVTLSPVELDINTTHVDATLIMEETEEGLKGWLQYNTDLFDASTVELLLSHFRRLLHEAASDPGRRVSELSLLDEGERRRLLADFNDTRSDYPRESNVHTLFAEQAARTPEAVALVSGDEEVSYAELNRRADGVARHLRAHGVGADSLVGVMLERSAELVVSLLGVLKAGAAYVPLDPQYPAERLRLMIEDADCPVVLTRRELAERLGRADVAVVCFEECEDSGASDIAAVEGTRVTASADSLAYVMYTSGSTGRPKGVAVSHRNIVRLVRGSDFASFSLDETFLLLAPVSFDASTFEMWGALLNGARLVLYPEPVATAAGLGRVIRRHNVTTMWLTASLFNAIVGEGVGELKGLRQLLAGGDVLSAPHVRRVLAEVPGCTVINGYGPTENTTFTCCHTIPQDFGLAEEASIPIGRPVANTRVYILDKQMAPAPVGAAGELYAGGDGLARGYLNRPGLTAERFVPDPFSTEPGARLYRTGDRARYLPNGEIEFLGRADNQVKIRGFRIEPGEVEAVLAAHESVRDVTVVVREDTPGDKRLVAYVVAEPGSEPAPGELKTHLRERLPEYMIPSAFVALDALPLTPNGKVDRRALPAPDAGRGSEEHYLAPRTPLEELLAATWAEVLRLPQVGVNDNFFDLGGHSLLATQVVTRVRESLRVELPLRVMFESPTVGGMAEAIERARLEGEGLHLPPVERVERGGHLPLSYTQQRLWFLDQLTPGTPLYNVPAAIRLSGRLDVVALERSLTEIVRRHEVLRTTFKTDGAGQPVQVIHEPRPEKLLVINLGGLPEAERFAQARRLAFEDARRPFDLSAGPLLRATLVRLCEDEYLALFTLHHIVSDAWSTGVLVGEVAALYGAFSQGEPSPLTELPVQYADYAAWQREWLRGETLERQLSYWRRQFATPPPTLELPTDHERPAEESFRGASLPVRVPRETAEQLKELSRREGVTLFMSLLAAYQTLLHRYTGQDDIVVGSPIANRSRAAVEALIGCFINTLALRTDLSGSPTFRKLLGRVREVTLDAYAHQDLPFETLVSELQPERRGNSTPLFQVWFVLQNTPAEPLRLPGLTISDLEVDSRVAQFDLTLALAEGADGLEGRLTYNSDLFEEATAAAMAEHYVTLLGEAAADPDRQLFDIPLGGEEREGTSRASSEWLGDEAAEDQFVI